jgi:hypothetical protein
MLTLILWLIVSALLTLSLSDIPPEMEGTGETHLIHHLKEPLASTPAIVMLR